MTRGEGRKKKSCNVSSRYLCKTRSYSLWILNPRAYSFAGRTQPMGIIHLIIQPTRISSCGSFQTFPFSCFTSTSRSSSYIHRTSNLIDPNPNILNRQRKHFSNKHLFHSNLPSKPIYQSYSNPRQSSTPLHSNRTWRTRFSKRRHNQSRRSEL